MIPYTSKLKPDTEETSTTNTHFLFSENQNGGIGIQCRDSILPSRENKKL